MRKIFIVGNVSTDPVQSQAGGRNVVNCNVAVNNRRREDPADFFRLSIWSPQTMDFVLKYIKKGDKVAVAGDFSMNTYVDRNGEKQTSLNITVDTLDSCGSRSGGASSDGGGAPAAHSGGDDDLPF